MAPRNRYLDVTYKMFSGTMMLLTLYGGYLCSMHTYRFLQRRRLRRLEAENQTEATWKTE